MSTRFLNKTDNLDSLHSSLDNELLSELPASQILINKVKQLDSSKLSTFQGVFIPVCLSIWGVITFLRFPYIIGQSGLLLTLGMFSFSYLITSLTSLSLCAISTNGTVKGGGPYYLISRSLGPEFGGSIGLIFYFGTLLTGSMSLFGFVESIIANFGMLNGSVVKVFPESRGFLILYSSLILGICLAVALIGTKMFARASVILALILSISTVSILLSLAFGAPFENQELEIYFTGWSKETLFKNLYPQFSNKETVASTAETHLITIKEILSVVFPACTGILAGASMSGDLKSPSRSIPNGTLGGVSFTFLLYWVLGILLAGSIDRISLKDNLAIMQDVSFFPWLVTLGVLTTTFFSALGSLIGASKVIEAISKDQLLYFLSRQSERKSTIISWCLIQLIVVLVSDLDEVASFVTMFSLLTFGVLNLACFLLRLTGSVNFRPSFSYFNWRTAALGMISCFILMFYVDQLSAAISCLIMFTIFVFIHYSCGPKPWGDVMQSLIYHQVRKYLLRLDSRKDHVKFWRPQICMLIDSPQNNVILIKFMNDMKKGGLFVLGHILKGEFSQCLDDYKRQMPAWLRFVDIGRIKAFVEFTIAKNERIGAQNLLIGSGLGGLKPNIVVMGFHDKNSIFDSEDPSADNSSEIKQRKISTSSWNKTQNLNSTSTSAMNSPALSPWFRPSKYGPQDSTQLMQEIALDPLCAELPKNSDIESGITAENYVGIIEDCLALNKAVAICKNFERMDVTGGGNFVQEDVARKSVFKRLKEEYKRLSSFNPADEQESLLLDSSVDEFRLPYSAFPVSSQKYIDLWPIQSGESFSHDNTAIYSFETYTLILQLGCILTMGEFWKENFKLRVIVFVENKLDGDSERERVELLLKGLRICASVKIVYLYDGDSSRSDSEEYDRLKKVNAQQQPSSSASSSSQSLPRRGSLLSTRISKNLLKNVDEKAGEFPEPTQSSSLFNTLEPTSQFIILNQLMKCHSSNLTTGIIFTTLPAPENGTGKYRERSLFYLDQIDLLTRDITIPLLLIHGKGLTVTTSL